MKSDDVLMPSHPAFVLTSHCIKISDYFLQNIWYSVLYILSCQMWTV